MPIDLKNILKSFEKNRFDPLDGIETNIPDESGNYIICLKSGSRLPIGIISPKFSSFIGLKVIYTGIASKSLRNRDFRQHFKGNNAGLSTLRKSLGVLFDYKLIPRDKEPLNGKTKFENIEERKLSEWMKHNLLMFYLPRTNFAEIEIALINHFNPPLNLKDNHNTINADYRKWLSKKRNAPINLKQQSKLTRHEKVNSQLNFRKSKVVKKNGKNADINEIINAIDYFLLENGKPYIILSQANRLLLNQGLIEDGNTLKLMLENGQIPNCIRLKGTVKQWRIVLSKQGEQLRKEMERAETREKKSKKIILKSKNETLAHEGSCMFNILLLFLIFCLIVRSVN